MKRAKVLVIEDYPSDAELFRHALEEMDYHVADLDNVTAAQRARRAAWLSSQPEKRAESSASAAIENGQ